MAELRGLVRRVEKVGARRPRFSRRATCSVPPLETVSEVDVADVAVFIIPGGDRWENVPVEAELVALLERLDAQGVPIAAICGATVAIARIGLLHGRRHTSNGLDYLRSQVANYGEASNYVEGTCRSRSKAHYREWPGRCRVRSRNLRGVGGADGRRPRTVGADVPERKPSQPNRMTGWQPSRISLRHATPVPR